jgi:sugar fermentation stimulation protein A
MKKYKFDAPLFRGVIRDRPNRFVMKVDVNGRITRCFCPCPTRIGSLSFKNIACLLSKNNGNNTEYTVEAISLSVPGNKKQNWIGINQTKINSYIEHFFRTGQLKKIVKNIETIQREYRLKRTRIDFLVNSALVEVKTPLTNLPYKSHLQYKEYKRFISYQRTVRHYKVLSDGLKRYDRAIMIHCFMYRAKTYQDIFNNINEINKRKIVLNATDKGVENWQLNMRIDEKGVSLLNYFKLNKKVLIANHSM